MNTILLWKSVTTMPLSLVLDGLDIFLVSINRHILICGSHARRICPSCAETNWIRFCSVHYGLERMLLFCGPLGPGSTLPFNRASYLGSQYLSAHGPWLSRSMGAWSNDRTSFLYINIKMPPNWKFLFCENELLVSKCAVCISIIIKKKKINFNLRISHIL